MNTQLTKSDLWTIDASLHGSGVGDAEIAIVLANAQRLRDLWMDDFTDEISDSASEIADEAIRSLKFSIQNAIDSINAASDEKEVRAVIAEIEGLL
jgi:methionine aminopeptidase